MKFAVIAIAIVLAANTAGGAIVNSMADVQFWVGSGANSAVMIVDWQDGKNLPADTIGQALAWGYHWKSGETRTGMDMLVAIAGADPRFDLKLDNRGFGEIVFGMYYDLNGNGGTYTFDPTFEEGTASDPADHFREGWVVNGFWGYLIGATLGANKPSWTVSGSGSSSRALANGAWDAWVFSTDLAAFSIPMPVPAAAVVPEPGSALLVMLGGVILLRRR